MIRDCEFRDGSKFVFFGRLITSGGLPPSFLLLERVTFERSSLTAVELQGDANVDVNIVHCDFENNAAGMSSLRL